MDDQHKLYCWGFNKYGNLGLGMFKVDKYSPTEVTISSDKSALPVEVKIGGGSAHTCLLDNANQVWCWDSMRMDNLALVPLQIKTHRALFAYLLCPCLNLEYVILAPVQHAAPSDAPSKSLTSKKAPTV